MIVKRLNWSSTSAGRPAPAATRNSQRLPRASPRRRAAAAPRPLDLRVEVAVDDVVVGAAGAAHGDRADQKQQEVPDDGRGQRSPAAMRAASAADHQHGHSSSHQPIGRSQRASRP